MHDANFRAQIRLSGKPFKEQLSMALFGTFADVSLPDLISLIGNSSGVCTIRQPYGDEVGLYELTMEEARISRMSYNGQEIVDDEQAHSFITEMIRNGGGEFEFHRQPVVCGPLSINITEALLTGFSMVDEMTVLQEHFPDPHTVFLRNQYVRVPANSEMGTFWVSVEVYFQEEGICAMELSDKVGLFLDQVLLKLYKLRAAEVIVPKRAFYQKTEPLPLAASREVNGNGLDPEILALTRNLKPIWQDAEPQETAMPARETAPPEYTQQEVETADLSSVIIYRPDKTLVSKFMSSLKKLIGKAS